MITALDHVALAVHDLDLAVEGYRRLFGREPNWIGGDGGARHAWFQLSNMALDVITPSGQGAFGDVIRRHLEQHGEGVWAIAFTVADIVKAQRLITRRGVRASPPGPTRSTHVDGRKRYWTTSTLDLGDTAGVQLLLVDPPRSGEPWPLSVPTADAASTVEALDHLVIRTSNPERALALYGARLGLDLRLDRTNEAWGARQLFFKCGSAVVELVTGLKETEMHANDHVDGLAWRVSDAAAAQARLITAGVDASDVRKGRKPGSQVFTVRTRRRRHPGVADPARLIVSAHRRSRRN